MKNAISIDLEDWYHPELVRKHIHGNPASQIIASTSRILTLLDKYNVKATFFILGEVANRVPDLIREIFYRGHEIASHGMTHLPLWELDYQLLDAELKTFKELIQGILKKKIAIQGYRAPTFSLSQRTRFGLKCLIENQFQYDSSIFPVKTPLYGDNKAPDRIYRPNLLNIRIEDPSSKIIEFPMTIIKIGPIKLPISGGFYFRVLPYFLLKFMLKFINRKLQKPFLIYFHPWETNPNTPNIRKIGFINSIITYFGINKSLNKIEKLLKDFEFQPIISLIKNKITIKSERSS